MLNDLLNIRLVTFSPQGTDTGLTMGAKAETEVYMPGFLRWATRAPWPPMEWPVMDLFTGSTGNRPWAIETSLHL